MSKIKVIIAVIIVLIVVGLAINYFSQPPKAGAEDYFVEDIGGDDFLIATLNHTIKLKEENIPDGIFKASMGNYTYSNAKNISYVDWAGCYNYIIVWKTTPDKYNFDITDKVNQYISDYSTQSNEKCFIEYSYENNAVYGIIIGSESNATFDESELMYEILGLNKDGFDLVYTKVTPSSIPSSSSSSDHYHTVVTDPYYLSRTDPDSYYDHYEYGDDYDIDDYLESEGYD